MEKLISKLSTRIKEYLMAYIKKIEGFFVIIFMIKSADGLHSAVKFNTLTKFEGSL